MLTNLFLLCAAAGGTAIVGQLLLLLFGFGHNHDAHHSFADDGHGVHPLGLLSFRTLSSVTAFFGIGGLSALYGGLGSLLSVGIASLCGLFGVLSSVAFARGLSSLRADGTLRLQDAIGKTAQVYLTLPGGSGSGKVTLSLQGRTVECEALSQEAVETGKRVLIVEVLGPGKVAVVPDPMPPSNDEEKL